MNQNKKSINKNPSGLIFKLNNQNRVVESTQTLTIPKQSTIEIDLASGGLWYGHGFAHRQPYPLNSETIINPRFAVNNIQSPLWFCSTGYAILVQTSEMLDVRFNEHTDGLLRITCAVADVHIYIIRASTLSVAHKKMMRHLGAWDFTPQPAFFGNSIFCTWTQYPRCINQERIVAMAQEIRHNKFPCSTITIDDRWESVFGELTFAKNFPDPGAMIDTLHKLGFSVLLWVTPFINQEAATFSQLADNGFLVKEKNSDNPSLLTWWGGTAGLVDLTNPAARQWYLKKLVQLKKEIVIDGFKIDGGDAKYQPDPEKSRWHTAISPSDYIGLLLGVFEEVAAGKCESRTAWSNQSQKIIWREGGKDTHWGIDNGLHAMVTLGLHLSLMGYDIFIPDMIPGRIQTMVSNHPLPTDELFVRWIEASTFMPIMQFSYFPWNYSLSTSTIARGFANVHKHMQSYIYASAKSRTAPLLRPLWYDFPKEQICYSINDQFMLGPSVVVAPVIKERQIARDIYLPKGQWVDAWTLKELSGGLHLQYPAPCPGIPVFINKKEKHLLSIIHANLQKIRTIRVEPGVTTATWQCGLDRDIKVTG